MFGANHLIIFIFVVVLHLTFGQSKKSTKFAKVECLQEGHDVFTMHMTTSNETITNVVGESELHLYMFGRKAHIPAHLKLEICQLLRQGTVEGRRNVLHFLKKGIKKAGKNFPDKCPFKRNFTYTLGHMQFDANVMPSYVPEYNFTYNGKFFANNVLTMTVWVAGGLCEFNSDCTGSGITFT